MPLLDKNNHAKIEDYELFPCVELSLQYSNEQSDEPLLPGELQVIIASSNGTSIADLVTDENGLYCLKMIIPGHYEQVAQSEDSPFHSMSILFDIGLISLFNVEIHSILLVIIVLATDKYPFVVTSNDSVVKSTG
ncbi:hypothetical protein ACTFIZ_011959 [Dictyostelium cf. discoideum]